MVAIKVKIVLITVPAHFPYDFQQEISVGTKVSIGSSGIKESVSYPMSNQRWRMLSDAVRT
jgi:hypothetical protein